MLTRVSAATQGAPPEDRLFALLLLIRAIDTTTVRTEGLVGHEGRFDEA